MNKEIIEKMIQEFEERKQIIEGCIQVLKLQKEHFELMERRENYQSHQQMEDKSNLDCLKTKINTNKTDSSESQPTGDCSTKQGHWEEIEYEDGCHTHKDTVWVEDKEQEIQKQ